MFCSLFFWRLWFHVYWVSMKLSHSSLVLCVFFSWTFDYLCFTLDSFWSSNLLTIYFTVYDLQIIFHPKHFSPPEFDLDFSSIFLNMLKLFSASLHIWAIFITVSATFFFTICIICAICGCVSIFYFSSHHGSDSSVSFTCLIIFGQKQDTMNFFFFFNSYNTHTVCSGTQLDYLENVHFLPR